MFTTRKNDLELKERGPGSTVFFPQEVLIGGGLSRWEPRSTIYRLHKGGETEQRHQIILAPTVPPDSGVGNETSKKARQHTLEKYSARRSGGSRLHTALGWGLRV